MDITKKYVEKAPPIFVDINNESFRTYVFPNKAEVTIMLPVKLNVTRKDTGDSHRIIDAQGVSHYIPSGWVHLYWQGKDGGTTYSF